MHDRMFADVPSSITSTEELEISCSSRRSKHSNILAPFEDHDSADLLKEGTVGDTISSIISVISFSRTVPRKDGSTSRSNSFTGGDDAELVASLKRYDSSRPSNNELSIHRAHLPSRTLTEQIPIDLNACTYIIKIDHHYSAQNHLFTLDT
jgi:hypothetical protein